MSDFSPSESEYNPTASSSSTDSFIEPKKGDFCYKNTKTLSPGYLFFLGKKRIRRPETWRRNAIKKRRAEGKEYVNWKGNIIPEKQIGPACECGRKCFTEERINIFEKIFREFNALANKEIQDAYLCGLIKCCAVSRRRSRAKSSAAERSGTYKYYLKTPKDTFQVCKKAFCSVHSVSTARVRRLTKYLRENIAAPADMRGRHSNRPNKVPDDILKQIDDHIKSFPKRRCHYGGVKTNEIRYLSSELNVSTMHKLYLQKYEPDVFQSLEGENKLKPVVTYDFYREYFLKNFKLSFGTPRTDTCQTCDNVEKRLTLLLSEEEKNLLLQQKNLHEKKASAFYADLKVKCELSVTESNIECIAFDFQQNMPLPLVPSGDAFYKRQLWVFNFCIFQSSKKISFMYMYDETVGKKGQNDVVSFLHHFIYKILDAKIKELYIFTDNCGAQNKNNVLVQYLYSQIKNGRFTRIIHHFPEAGHSFLPCDRSFGVIEKYKKRIERAYTPNDYRKIVSKCSKKFKVINVTSDMIHDIKSILEPSFLKTYINTENKKEKWLISKYKIFDYVLDEGIPRLRVSLNHSLLNSKEFRLEKQPNVPITFPLNPAPLYTEALPLKEPKYKDVMELAEKYVPRDDMIFYDGLKCENVANPLVTDELLVSEDE